MRTLRGRPVQSAVGYPSTMELWSLLTVVLVGVWTVGVLAFSLMRLPGWWHAKADAAWRADFTKAVTSVDRYQPILLVATIAITTWFALGMRGTTQILAVAALAGLVAVLVGSVAFLVPLQRRLMKEAPGDEAGKHRWITGHIGRTLVGSLAFAFVVLAVTL